MDYLKNISLGATHNKRFLKNMFDDFHHSIDWNKEFVKVDNKLFLFLSLERENTTFQTHLISRKRLLWVPHNLIESRINELSKDIASKSMEILLFVNDHGIDDFIFLGEVLSSEIRLGSEPPNEMKRNLKGFFVELPFQISLDLWKKIGWDVKKNVI